MLINKLQQYSLEILTTIPMRKHSEVYSSHAEPLKTSDSLRTEMETPEVSPMLTSEITTLQAKHYSKLVPKLMEETLKSTSPMVEKKVEVTEEASAAVSAVEVEVAEVAAVTEEAEVVEVEAVEATETIVKAVMATDKVAMAVEEEATEMAASETTAEAVTETDKAVEEATGIEPLVNKCFKIKVQSF